MTETTGAKRPLDSTTHALTRRLVRDHVRPHWQRLAGAMICMSLVAGATAANAWLMQPALDDVFLNNDRLMLVLIPIAVLAIALIKGGASYGQAVLMNYVGQRIIADIQTGMFGHLMRADLSFFHATSTGRLISRFTNDVQLLRNAVSTALTGIIKDFLTVIFLIGVMVYQDWLLAIVALVLVPMAFMPIVSIGRRMRRVSTNTQIEMGQLTTLLDETFQGARHIKAYGMEDYETSRAGKSVEAIFRLLQKAVRVRALSHPIMETLSGAAIAVVIFYGGSQVIAGTTTPGTFFSFIAALLMAYQPLKSLANLNANLQEGLAAAERVFQLLDIEPEIRDRPNASALGVTAGRIQFDNVEFAYTPDKPALGGVTLEVPGGKTVALVGPSGAGKSTILNLIPRFYDVDRGSLTIDGTDIREVTLASLRARIGLVSQEITLFDDSVRNNIAYGRPGAEESEVIAAAKAAAADTFIRTLPDGYDTMVGEHGVTLSGGQRQRLAIARAMIKDAPILLLDEATSTLDSESERQVQTALTSLMRGRTTLVIAHRLSTVVNADIIYVIDRGRVTETGTHAELLARNGAYARLYALQFAEEGDNGEAAAAGG